jgi:DtxR family Mn-dependent transcriptional regulator
MAAMRSILIVAVAAAAALPAAALALWRGLRSRRAFRLQVRIEDALRHLYAAEERGGRPTIESVAGSLHLPGRRAAELARILHERGLATTAEGLVLTPAGRRTARQIVQAHRLWERYLADELRVPAVELHRRADRQEHHLSKDEVEHLAARLGHPQHDPHGDPIPTADQPGRVLGWPLTLMARGASGEIVHLEDEPEAVFARLAMRGLEPGQRVTVLETAPDRLVVEVDGQRHQFSPVDAANVFVVPVREPAGPLPRTLADLRPGERGTVRAVRLTGFARRRLFDLGFTPGARVEFAFPAAFGEPRAYRVRDTLIALRTGQARRIEIEPATDADAP